MNVAVIPARGGSRRIPRKNIRPFHGKPVIAYSIEAAERSGLFDDIVVSTEDEEIAHVACQYGAWVLHRPPHLAEIDAPDCGTQEVMRYSLSMMREYEFAYCIYATAPTMTAYDLLIGHSVLLAKDEYAYIDGWFYAGRAQWFIEGRPLPSTGMQHPERWVDINEESDWCRSEDLYRAMLHA